MKKPIELLPGDAFLFRYHSHWWQMFGRGYGGVKVIAVEPHAPIVHLCVLGMEEGREKSIINHVPIMISHVLPSYVQAIPAEKPEWRDTTHAWEDLSEWRSRAYGGDVAAFDVPLPEALGLVCNVWKGSKANTGGTMQIASAYPVMSEGERYSTVRIVAWE